MRQQHEWRWVVGVVGKVLIVTGLLMFAFVAYQLWGTGIYTAQAQHRLDDQFNRSAVPATTATPATTTAPATTSTPSTSTVSTPTASASSTAAPSSTTATTATTTGSAATSASADGVAYPFAAPEDGKVLVQLQIPRISVNYKVVEGVGLADLAKGPGHFPESVLPGQLGNSAIAGHRTTHGAPFYDVDELRPGDEIVLTYPRIGGADGPRFVYLVTRTDIVSPSDYAAVVPTTDPTRATLVLSSCHPIRSASQRIIIRADLDTTQSSPLFAATTHGTADAGATIP
ncbi:MAG: peptidase family protein, partial [Ilumatobacteraceae bacterium]|nr:peptidase family protein [Ilumatobacteraceae bacterium]